MSFFVVDVESDGPCPGLYSMISIGAVKVDENLNCTFFGKTKPVSDVWIPDALAISDISRETHLTYPEPEYTMRLFNDWVKGVNSNGRPVFVSDNVAYDWQFINYYFHKYVGVNPFGFSGRRIGDLWCGMEKDAYSHWTQFRKTKHTHNPVDDAMGNAEVMLLMKEKGLKINF